MSDSVALNRLRSQIAREAQRQSTYSYADNIIRTALQQIDQMFGRSEANKAIDDFGLLKLGWNHETCEHCGHWPCGCGG